MSNYLEVATAAPDAVIKIFGLGDLHLAPVLDELAQDLLHAVGVKHLAIDLQHCNGMDSTFMGTLTGITANYAEQSGWMCVTNISAENHKLLEMLGVATFIQQKNQFTLAVVPSTRVDIPDVENHAQRLQVIKKAHQQLIKLDQRNREKFGAFLKMLNAEIIAPPTEEQA